MLDNILRSGYTFSEDEYELKIKYMMAIGTLIITFVFFLILAIIFYMMHDTLYAKLFGISSFLSFIAILFHRVAGKQNYARTIYIGALFFFLLILYSYYLTPYRLTTTAWIVIQVVSAFLVLDIMLALWITSLFALFMFGNYIVFEETMISILLQISPVLLSFLLVYIIDKKFTMSIYLLEDLNAILERRVKERTSELEAEKSKLIYQAHYDDLTTLPNRLLLKNELIKHFQTKNRISIFVIDLDSFKNINDIYGHDTGDMVLRTVAHRLKTIKEKNSFLARMSGDEFILISSTDTKEKILALKMINAIERPIHVNNKTLYVSATIGISTRKDTFKTIDDAIILADIAMFEAKKKGKGLCSFYTEEMMKNAQNKIKFESEIKQAFNNDEFVLHYQPQVDIIENKISAVEVLIRWNSPIKGFLYPNAFIQTCEELGLIIELDYYVLHQGMIQIVQWLAEGYEVPRLSFNISGQHVQKNLYRYMKKTLESTQCPPQYLELEITEGYLMKNMEESIKILEKFQTLGITIAIDDFGKGYSSLEYIKSLPIDKIKVDKSFIHQVDTNSVDAVIVNSVLNIANSLDIDVVAEGVENKAQKEYLEENNFRYLQGYFYYKPMSQIELKKILLPY